MPTYFLSLLLLPFLDERNTERININFPIFLFHCYSTLILTLTMLKRFVQMQSILKSDEIAVKEVNCLSIHREVSRRQLHVSLFQVYESKSIVISRTRQWTRLKWRRQSVVNLKHNRFLMILKESTKYRRIDTCCSIEKVIQSGNIHLSH